MFTSFYRRFLRRRKKNQEIAPDEIFIDASNLPAFNTSQFEGRFERPISEKTIFWTAISLTVIGLVFGFRVFALQIERGSEYALQSEQNKLRHMLIFAERGIVRDRNNVLLAWNVPSSKHPEFSSRKYASTTGLAHTLGYIGYPAKDKAGFYYSTDYTPHAGVEEVYNKPLSGEPGDALLEINALGEVHSQSTVHFPKNGEELVLSIDSRVQSKLYELMKELAGKVGFTGGAGVIMDVKTGELLAITSFPEYNPSILTEGEDSKTITSYTQDPKKPFLDRATAGLYTPGSIIKPFIALAALNEKIIDPSKKILSTGSISIPNPYDKTKKSVFNDWRAHGWIDMRQALAVSSDVYFYELGGGFEDQQGLGIGTIKKYMMTFGFGSAVPGDFSSDKTGVLPDPQWKEETFGGDIWRIGDTYHTSIGQYGMQVTPLQAVRGSAVLANKGKLLTPTILKDGNRGRAFYEDLPIPKEYYTIVEEGMREGVKTGTAVGLNTHAVAIAAKTGTAELGATKAFVNSWVTGFFPYENPRYAFTVLMERGPRGNTFGALSVMRGLVDWMEVYTPEYLK